MFSKHPDVAYIIWGIQKFVEMVLSAQYQNNTILELKKNFKVTVQLTESDPSLLGVEAQRVYSHSETTVDILNFHLTQKIPILIRRDPNMLCRIGIMG